MPSTRPGKWSVRSLVAFIAALAVFFALVASGQRGGDTFFSNGWLSAAILLAAACAISGGVTGLFAIFKASDRGPLVIASAAVGVVVVAYVLLEVVFPH